jgi:hydroxypyruvate reductase
MIRMAKQSNTTDLGAATPRRALLRSMFDAAVAAAHPDHILPRHLPPPPAGDGRIVCLAVGKAGAAMAAAAERHYLDTLGLNPARLTGLATTRHGHGVPTRRLQVIEAGHPMPDAASQRAASTALTLARGATSSDLVLVLLSGGGSANWIAPVPGITFAQKQEVTRLLLRSGEPIGAVNTVRKHLSAIKGGRLAQAAAPATLVTLAISDVPDDDPAVIASGPTVADPTTLADARAILARAGIRPDAAILRALDDPANETVKPGADSFARATYTLIARPRDALDAAIAVAQEAGYAIHNIGSDLEGEARESAAAHARLAMGARAAGQRLAIVSGGELTVTVRGRGHGGPNQEYALGLLAALPDCTGIAALAADTDGADGGAGHASDPAGAFVDTDVHARAIRLGLHPQDFLSSNDATAFFARARGLLVTGPTLTNVNDLRIILVDP